MTFIPDGIITGNILNTYTADCNISNGEFSLVASSVLGWYDGIFIKCIVQYGSDEKTTDKFVEKSSVINITGMFSHLSVINCTNDVDISGVP